MLKEKNTTVTEILNSDQENSAKKFILKAYETWYKDIYSYAKDTYARKKIRLEQFEDNQYTPVGGGKAGILQHTRTRFVDDGKNDIRLFDVKKYPEDYEPSDCFCDQSNTGSVDVAYVTESPTKSSGTKSGITHHINR